MFFFIWTFTLFKLCVSFLLLFNFLLNLWCNALSALHPKWSMFAPFLPGPARYLRGSGFPTPSRRGGGTAHFCFVQIEMWDVKVRHCSSGQKESN